MNNCKSLKIQGGYPYGGYDLYEIEKELREKHSYVL